MTAPVPRRSPSCCSILSFLVLLVLRFVGSRAAKREELSR